MVRSAAEFRALALGAAAALLAGLGLWISFHYTFGVWRPDPDIFVTIELWRGARRFGLPFLASWAYTQDNWLLSLLPLASAAYEIFGPTPRVAVAVGWFVFLSSVGMTAWLAWRLAGRGTAVALGCVLLFAGVEAIGGAGYLSYPISHNVSMAWALLALILALRGIERQAWAWCVAAGACVFVDALSDPWAAAAIGGPLLLAGAGLAVLHRGSRLGRTGLVLAAAAFAAVIAAHTRLFGLLDFLPRSHFQLADPATMLVNLYWAYRSLAAIFNIVPGAGLEASAPRILSALALVLLFGGAAVLTLRRFRDYGVGRQFVTTVALLSMAAVAALFVVGRWPVSNLMVGRFMPNFYYLGALLTAVLAAERWRAWPRAAKAALAVYAGLFMAAGAASGSALWTSPHPAADDGAGEAVALARFLESQGLTYGYGPFWGAHALVMDTITAGRVTIRPITFRDGRVARRPAQTAAYWYLPADEPATPRRFVIVRNDGEECPSPAACVEAARRQLGPPSEEHVFGDYRVLVWPRPISALIDK
jgi:hypothetical protein